MATFAEIDNPQGRASKGARRAAWEQGVFVRYVTAQPKGPNAPTLPTLPAWYRYRIGEVPSVYTPSATDSSANDWSTLG